MCDILKISNYIAIYILVNQRKGRQYTFRLQKCFPSYSMSAISRHLLASQFCPGYLKWLKRYTNRVLLHPQQF